MADETYNIVSTVLGILTLIGTLAGLYAVFYQIRELVKTTWSNTHSKLADQSFELLKFMSDHPDTYDYFYHGKALDAAGNKTIVLYIAEALANFLEHLVLQEESLPDDQWQVWRRFTYSTLKSSVVVRNFIREHSDWYSKRLLEVVKECAALNDA